MSTAKNYQRVKGTANEELVRGVNINGTDSNIVVEIKKNNKKGTFTISGKITTKQVAGNLTDDKALTDQVSELMLAASRIALDWKKNWSENQPSDVDPAQMKIEAA